ncbi:MAG: hypothetical protein ACTSUE_09910 [Promethearchaeota archaeon]
MTGEGIMAGSVISNDEAEPRGFVGKLRVMVNKNFSNILSKEHWVYTLIFFVSVLVLSLFSLIESSLAVLTVVIFISTTLIIMFAILFVMSNMKSFESRILKCEMRTKLGWLGLVSLISFGIFIVLYLVSLPLGAGFRLEAVLPIVYSVVFVGWNFIQIFFIRKGLEGVSSRMEGRFIKESMNVDDKKKVSRPMVVLSMIGPIAGQAGLVTILFVNPNNTIDTLQSSAIGVLILGLWMIGMFLVLIIAMFNIRATHNLTIKHGTPSVFAPVLHALFWFYIIYRSYAFIVAMNKSLAGIGEMTVSDRLVDSIFIVVSLFLLFKGLGSKLKRTSFFTKHTLPFMAYLLSMIVVMGRISLILGIPVGGALVPLSQSIIAAVNNLMMMSVAIIFYFIYFKNKLEDLHYLEKDTYSVREVNEILGDFLGVLKDERFLTNDYSAEKALVEFLLTKDLQLDGDEDGGDGGGGSDGDIQPLHTIQDEEGTGGARGNVNGSKSGAIVPPVEEQDPVESKYPLEKPSKIDDKGSNEENDDDGNVD